MNRALTIALIDTKKINPNHYLVKATLRSLGKSARVGRVDLLHYDNLNSELAARPYDVLIAIDGENLNTGVFSRAVKRVKLSVLWVWEDPYERRVNINNAQLFDLVFTNDRASASVYGSKGHFLALGAEIEHPVITEDKKFSHDLFFAGSAWPNRVTFLRRLQREMPDLKTKIVLQYNPGVPRAFLDRPESDYNGSITHTEFLALANSSKVTLTLHRKFSGDGNKRSASTPGPRVFEVALAGGCQIIDSADVDIEPFFQNGIDVALFSGFDEFRNSLLHLLNTPAKRFELARNSQHKARIEHTFDVRVEQMLERIDAASGTRPLEAVSDTESRKKTLLFVTHNSMMHGSHFGGVEVYQQTIADEISDDYRILFFFPAPLNPRSEVQTFTLTDHRYSILATFFVPSFESWKSLSNIFLERVFANILLDHQIDLVHFQHLINFSASLPLVAKMLGVASVFTFHDFWTVCYRFNLIDHTGRYCAIAERPKVTCDICLKVGDKIQPGSQAFRREFFGAVLSSFDVILFSTHQPMDICRRIYPHLEFDRHTLIGIPAPRAAVKSSFLGKGGVNLHSDSAPLRVVFLGNFTKAKGADVFLNAASVMGGDEIHFSIYGRFDEAYKSEEAYKRFIESGYKNVHFMGEFTPGDLDLSQFDVSLHLSIWPETYCITLSEAWQAGLIPIVSDCGALGERVTHDVNGYKIPVGDSGRLVSVLRQLADRRELARLQAQITPGLWLTSAEHAEHLKAVYERAMVAQPSSRCPMPSDATSPGATLELTSLAPFQKDWTKPTPFFPVPQYGRNLRRLSPHWEDTREISRALVDGRVAVSHLAWAMDSFGQDVVDLQQWRTHTGNASRHSRPKLRGWFSSDSGFQKKTFLGLRSANSDVVLIPFTSEHRLDVFSSRGHSGIGFLTEEIVVDMLDTGVYGLELYIMLPNRMLQATALPFAVNVGAQTTCLRMAPVDSGHRGQAVPWIPLPSLAWPEAEPHRSEVHFHVDMLTVHDYAPTGGLPCHVLEASGWLVARGRYPHARLILRLRGKETRFVPLTMTDRQDVLEEFGNDIELDTGFTGIAFLSGLPDDDYELSLLFQTVEGAGAVSLGTLPFVSRAATPSLALRD